MTESAADRPEVDLDGVPPETGDDEAQASGADSSDASPEAAGGEGSSGGEPGAADQGHDAPSADAGEQGVDKEGSAEAEDSLQEKFDALNDRHLRLVAEFNNYRRRNEQERLTAWSRAQADLVGGFLDVLDDLHRVAELDLSNATVEAIMEGIDLVERKFIRALGDASVEMVDPTGQPFDPEVMEAMMRVPSEDEAQIDTVAQCFQKGSSLKGILVRPARVSVYTQG